MRKTFLLLFASMAIVAGAQNVGNCCMDTANCTMECHNNGFRKVKGNRPNRLAFMKDLDEKDRTTVKDLMEQYRNDRKAIMEKCRAQKPAKGVKPTEEQMDAMMKARYTSRMEVLKLKEKYYDKLRKTLNPMQANALLNRDMHSFKGNGRPGYARQNNGRGNHKRHQGRCNGAC